MTCADPSRLFPRSQVVRALFPSLAEELVAAPVGGSVSSAQGKLQVSVICPLHGPIIRASTAEILREYREWTKKQLAAVSNGSVAVIYASAYGNTAALAQAIARGATKAGVAVESLNCEFASPEEVAELIRRTDGFTIGSPTLGGHMPTPVKTALGAILRETGARAKPCGVFGSFGWSGEAVDELESRLKDGGLSFAFDTIRCKMKPTDATLQASAGLPRYVSLCGPDAPVTVLTPVAALCAEGGLTVLRSPDDATLCFSDVRGERNGPGAGSAEAGPEEGSRDGHVGGDRQQQGHRAGRGQDRRLSVRCLGQEGRRRVRHARLLGLPGLLQPAGPHRRGEEGARRRVARAAGRQVRDQRPRREQREGANAHVPSPCLLRPRLRLRFAPSKQPPRPAQASSPPPPLAAAPSGALSSRLRPFPFRDFRSRCTRLSRRISALGRAAMATSRLRRGPLAHDMPARGESLLCAWMSPLASP